MSLIAGNRVGPYEVLGVIGAGGMGEVYKVRDTRLDRIVAIKVLPAAFIADPDRRARFEREAQAIAALSHPNILAIHDIGVHDGQMFVVTELLEGETLRDRLHAGGVPVRKAIECAVQIARALAAAHEKAIVHRDLKPENVFLLADGQMKLIDFGLAKAHVDRGVVETMTATEPGTVMGTVGYMAPEQVRGLTVDARADLFALGAVLYEMLSGRPAFNRDTAADTMTAVLNADPPPLTGTQTDFSPALQRVVNHALEKNPNERFQSARDFGFALDVLSGTATSAATAISRATRRPRIRSYAAMILIVAALTGSYVVGRHSVTPVGLDDIRFEPKTFEPQFITNARFLPDGQSIVFSAALEGNVPELFVSRPNTLAPQPLGHPRTHLLSVSSKGELAVLTGAKFIGHRLYLGTLARMPIDGAPRAWMTNAREADWSPDGSSLAVVHSVERMDRLEYPIGNVLYESAGYLSDPRVSPDGVQVAFCEHPVKFDDRGWVKIVDRSGTVRTLAGEYAGIQGVAWMLDAQRILFSATTGGIEGYQPHVVPASGSAPARVALPSMGSVNVQDVGRDGGWIAIRTEERASIRARLPGDSGEREFSWMNDAHSPYLSVNGEGLLFTDQSASGGANYAVMYRDTSGGQPVRIGEGIGLGLSTDGAWALAYVPSPRGFVLYPLGPGDPVRLDRLRDRLPIGRVNGMRWFPDGKHVLICGSEPSKPSRCYRQDIVNGQLVPITPEGVASAWVTTDNRTLLTWGVDKSWRLVPVAGGPSRPARGLTNGDNLLAWARDGRSVFVRVPSEISARIERVDLTSGARLFVREIAPPDRAGLVDVRSVSLIEDAAGYAYVYGKRTSTLFVVRDAR